MKQLFVVICFFLKATYGFGQSDTIITYTEVVIVEGLTKDQLFQNARQWYNKSFISSKEVLQIVDKETGEISGKGLLKSQFDFKMLGSLNTNDCYYRFLLEIKVKEGRYKYTFTNFTVDATLTPGIGDFPVLTSTDECPKEYPMVSTKNLNNMYSSMKMYLDQSMKLFVANLKSKMAESGTDDF